MTGPALYPDPTLHLTACLHLCQQSILSDYKTIHRFEPSLKIVADHFKNNEIKIPHKALLQHAFALRVALLIPREASFKVDTDPKDNVAKHKTKLHWKWLIEKEKSAGLDKEEKSSRVRTKVLTQTKDRNPLAEAVTAMLISSSVEQYCGNSNELAVNKFMETIVGHELSNEDLATVYYSVLYPWR